MKSSYLWDRKRILIVEDDDSSSFLLNEILKDTQANLAFAADGSEAVEHIKTNPKTDLILMDINLPDMDGLTATKLIKALDSKVVVIAQTAFSSSSDQQKAMEAGFDDFLAKPLNPYLLLSKIDSFLHLE